MKLSVLQLTGRADLPVGQDARQRVPTWFRTLVCGRMFVGGLPQLWFILTAWLAPNPRWRRYRVTPRANPAAFRHQLLRGIQLELHRAGLAGSRELVSRTTL